MGLPEKKKNHVRQQKQSGGRQETREEKGGKPGERWAKKKKKVAHPCEGTGSAIKKARAWREEKKGGGAPLSKRRPSFRKKKSPSFLPLQKEKKRKGELFPGRRKGAPQDQAPFFPRSSRNGAVGQFFSFLRGEKKTGTRGGPKGARGVSSSFFLLTRAKKGERMSSSQGEGQFPSPSSSLRGEEAKLQN